MPLTSNNNMLMGEDYPDEIVRLFFCKQNTAYEVRIRDWSSDGSSADLAADACARRRRRQGGIEDGKEEGLAKIARRYLEVAGRGRRVEFLFGPDLLAIDGNHVLDGRGQ